MMPVVENPFSWMYFPTALALGALHALEPGHAKALTASYLIGIKGTKKDALFLGLSVAFTHSLVVIGISVTALWLGREMFTKDITHWLQIGSGAIVVVLGLWMLLKRIRLMRRQQHEHHHALDPVQIQASNFKIISTPQDERFKYIEMHKPHEAHNDHSQMSDDEHARAHAATIPEYAKRGERPSLNQIITFGAAGGMIPCPASITVMLLALSIGKFASGILAVLGFSIGLAITLVGIGMIVVAGISRLQTSTGRLHLFSTYAPIISAVVVILSGTVALLLAH